MTPLRIVAVLSVLIVAVAACSSGSASDRPSTVSSDARTTSSQTPDPETDKSAASSSSTHKPAKGAEREAQRTCATLSANIKLLTNAAGGGAGPQLQQQIATMRALRTTAPTAIRSDVATVAKFDQQILDTVAADHQSGISQTPQLTTALEHIVDWIATHCS
jgi:hypothetical protein